MSEILNLNALLGSLPATSDPNVGNVLAFDSTGNPTKTSVAKLKYTDISGKEEPGVILTLENFVKKYLSSLPPGTMITVHDAAQVREWFVKLTDTLNLATRLYFILLTRRTGNMTGPYHYISFTMIPTFVDGESPKIICVSCATNGQSQFSAHICMLPMTKVT